MVNEESLDTEPENRWFRIRAVNMSTTWRSNVSLARETAGLISERILSGRYQPGEQLPQAWLSEQLGVSRTPLRDALNLLENDGMIQIDDLGRASVTRMASHLLKEVLAYRRIMETGACELVQHGTAAQLEQLAAGNPGPWTPRSRSGFHTGLLECSRNNQLRRSVPLVRMSEEVFLPACAWYEEAAASLDRHIETSMAAIIRGSVPQAQQEPQKYFDELLNLIDGNERTAS
ncbi:GntR family transcriptional regulator [Glutamicibacter halophytocola]|uniref:GntR family transcriptional regulator n=1 Tax=Glutamicibacter halophytocola TaxID=1933880 RepID=UPI00321A3765